MDGEGLGGITLTRLSFLKQSLTPAIDGSPYDDKMIVSGTKYLETPCVILDIEEGSNELRFLALNRSFRHSTKQKI